MRFELRLMTLAALLLVLLLGAASCQRQAIAGETASCREPIGPRLQNN